MKTSTSKPPQISQQELAKLNAENAELQLILSAGVPKELVKIEDVQIGDLGSIHSIQVGPERIVKKEGNNVLVMLHGYGAPASSYFRLVPYLIKEFHVVLFDLPGMNFSSRTKDLQFNSLETCLEFCLVRIAAAIDALGIEHFNLAGHSIGGFLSGHLFKSLHERIIRVIFLSPAGVNPPADDQLNAVLKKNAGKNILKRMFMSNFLNFIFVKKQPPFQYFKIGPLKRFLIHFYVSNKRFQFSNAEKQYFKAMSNYFIGLPPCGEYMVCYLMHFGPKSFAPIMDVLTSFADRQHDMIMIYGETDVLDHHLTIERLKEVKAEVQVTYLPKADHQLIFQNLETLSQMMIDHLKKGPKDKKIHEPVTDEHVPLDESSVDDKKSPEKQIDERVYEIIEEESVLSVSKPATPNVEKTAPLTPEEQQLQTQALDEASRLTGELIL